MIPAWYLENLLIVLTSMFAVVIIIAAAASPLIIALLLEAYLKWRKVSYRKRDNITIKTIFWGYAILVVFSVFYAAPVHMMG